MVYVNRYEHGQMVAQFRNDATGDYVSYYKRGKRVTRVSHTRYNMGRNKLEHRRAAPTRIIGFTKTQ